MSKPQKFPTQLFVTSEGEGKEQYLNTHEDLDSVACNVGGTGTIPVAVYELKREAIVTVSATIDD